MQLPAILTPTHRRSAAKLDMTNFKLLLQNRRMRLSYTLTFAIMHESAPHTSWLTTCKAFRSRSVVPKVSQFAHNSFAHQHTYTYYVYICNRQHIHQLRLHACFTHTRVCVRVCFAKVTSDAIFDIVLRPLAILQLL